ncbi:hypothetical protein [Streptomyces canus]|uniref:hypothetical protein n=1 Tax=Streptomyces canus TaxID=58343 RepID=UPI0036E8751D
MTRLIAAVSVSPDGNLAGPDPSPDNDRTRAVVLGHLVDEVDEPSDWEDPPGHGAHEVGSTWSVVTGLAPGSVRTIHVGPTFVTAERERAEAAAPESGKEFDLTLTGRVCHGRLGGVSRTGRRSVAAPRAQRHGRQDTAVHRRSAVHAHAAERDLGLDRRAAPALRRLAVTR